MATADCMNTMRYITSYMNLKKLAEELNLSFSTVSKALRDSHEISIATKNRVIAKANELNYQVNPLASSFRKQKTKTIALDHSGSGECILSDR